MELHDEAHDHLSCLAAVLKHSPSSAGPRPTVLSVMAFTPVDKLHRAVPPQEAVHKLLDIAMQFRGVQAEPALSAGRVTRQQLDHLVSRLERQLGATGPQQGRLLRRVVYPQLGFESAQVWRPCPRQWQRIGTRLRFPRLLRSGMDGGHASGTSVTRLLDALT